MTEGRPDGRTRCPQCGTPALPGTLFCDHCGAALSEEAKSPFRIFPYDENRAKIQRAHESAKSRWVRGITYLGVPLVVGLVDTEGTWLEADWMPYVLFVLGLIAFVISLIRRRPFMAAKRSACIFDPRTTRNYYATLAKEEAPEDPEDVPAEIRKRLDEVSDLLARGTLFEKGNPIERDGMRLWSDEGAEPELRRRNVTRYRYPAGAGKTGHFDVPHAFPGSPLTGA